MEETNIEKIIRLIDGNIEEKIASEIISEIFKGKNNTEQIITEAVEEICARLTKVIYNAFMDEYIADTNSIGSLLLEYNETRDGNTNRSIEKLEYISEKALFIINRLRPSDVIEGILACVYISNLRIVAIKALSEYDPTYTGVLIRVGKEYAYWAESASKRIVDLTKESVGHINVFSLNSTTNPPDTGNPYAGYYIRKGSNNTVSLNFYTTYEDKWASSDRLRFRSVTSESIILTSTIYYFEQFPSIYLSKEGEKALREEYDEFFFKKAREGRDNFLQERLNTSNSMDKKILSVCESWKLI